ncbi:DJ-1/PfpI family protein [Nonomuraea soli]|uniref:Transcriptional regulator GlxA family with amidase domain n=1 Tax=Nonomuraea soli TaxID=1032476 RepID=A0A7W0CIV5_9ACTN|nr:DJ-1/PfpI family protein [Nonomuraea soli]MBA2891722.1 transcriptional regulator GlxA family with amidase domain [Nonomuraea soli]
MHVAIPLYPRFTALDVVGPYTALAFAPGWKVTFVAGQPGPVTDDQGSLTLMATASYEEVPRPDVIVVPGGPGTVAAMNDTALTGWLAAAHEHTTWTASVCSGSFVLAAAGLLAGRRATSHWGWVEHLQGLGTEPVSERVVFDGKIVTAAGVSAGIDMGLELLARESGEGTAQAVQLAIEYDPRPPYDMKTLDGRRDEAMKLISID